MGIFSEYIDQNLDWPTLVNKRKEQLSEISRLRGGRAILTFAAALSKQAPTMIEYDDRIHFIDQISNLSGDKIDIILETPGGYAEVVEDLVHHVRSKFSEVAIIVPGYAKSAGTIMAMAGDEILMDSTSALGPIDAQMSQNNKGFSAHAFLEGLEKIKSEVASTGVLNRAYVPML
ncbi:MAG: Clp protease ClpP, partial [Deltaproteobacteria bacterium]